MKKHLVTVLALSLLATGCPDDSEGDPLPVDAAARSDAALPADSGARADAGTAHDASTAGDASVVPDASTISDASALGDYASLNQQVLTKYKSCGAYEPSVDLRLYTVADGFDACIARCALAASCDEIKALFCDGDENAFETCIDVCDDGRPLADGYRCQDGNVIPHLYLCDFEPDCANDEDERNCGEYTCANGERVPNAVVRCDQFENCEDGSDEQGCAVTCG